MKAHDDLRNHPDIWTWMEQLSPYERDEANRLVQRQWQDDHHCGEGWHRGNSRTRAGRNSEGRRLDLLYVNPDSDIFKHVDDLGQRHSASGRAPRSGDSRATPSAARYAMPAMYQAIWKQLAEDDPNAEKLDLERERSIEALHVAIPRLPGGIREVVDMAFDGRSTRDIARRLGISQSTITRRWRNAIVLLREDMYPEDVPETEISETFPEPLVEGCV
jgi:RNA polymerase sigma factor (sigma-70 family)